MTVADRRGEVTAVSLPISISLLLLDPRQKLAQTLQLQWKLLKRVWSRSPPLGSLEKLEIICSVTVIVLLKNPTTRGDGVEVDAAR